MIVIENLQKVIDKRTVIDIPKLEVKSGEIIAVVGPIGSGKSELFDLLIGKERPTMGSVSIIDSFPYEDKGRFSKTTGVVFAEDSLYKHRTPMGNLKFHCQLRGLLNSRCNEVLLMVGLGDQTKIKVEDLHSGLARRLAFGVALLHDPQVLIIFDPFARCDEATIAHLSRLMIDLASDGKTLLVLADDNTHLAAVCQRLFSIDQGRLMEIDAHVGEEQSSIPFKIPVRAEGKVLLINPGDILYADTHEGKAYLQTSDSRLATQFSLGELEQKLSRSGFFRAHRAYLVNLQHVKEVIPYTRNSYTLRLDDEIGTEIPLSKAAASELRDLLGY